MKPLIEFVGFRLERQGREFSAELRPGGCLGVYGPSGAGKSAFLRAAAGLDRVRHGHVRRRGDAVLAGDPVPNRKSSVEGWARRFAGAKGTARIAEALAATELWNDRKKSIGNLNPGQQAAVELLGVLGGEAPILVIDGQLDRIDPWTMAGCERLLAKRLAEGACALLATHRTEWLDRFDVLSVWRQHTPVFAGTYQDLERSQGGVRIEVETLRNRDMRALCDPFEVRIQESSSGLAMEAPEGQSLAARLLLEGYGDVRAVVVRPRKPEELLRSLGV